MWKQMMQAGEELIAAFEAMHELRVHSRWYLGPRTPSELSRRLMMRNGASCPERHGTGSSPAQPCEAMQRPWSNDDASGAFQAASGRERRQSVRHWKCLPKLVRENLLQQQHFVKFSSFYCNS